MRTRSALALVIVVRSGGGSPCRPARTGRDKLVAGDYKTAIAELSKVTRQGPDGRAHPARSRADRRPATTQPPKARSRRSRRARTRRRSRRGSSSNEIRQQRPAAAPTRARISKRCSRTSPTIARSARRSPRFATAQGAVVDAKTLFDQTIKEFDEQKLNLDDPMQLYQLAEAARLHVAVRARERLVSRRAEAQARS